MCSWGYLCKNAVPAEVGNIRTRQLLELEISDEPRGMDARNLLEK